RAAGARAGPRARAQDGAGGAAGLAGGAAAAALHVQHAERDLRADPGRSRRGRADGRAAGGAAAILARRAGARARAARRRTADRPAGTMGRGARAMPGEPDTASTTSAPGSPRALAPARASRSGAATAAPG